MGRLVNIEPGLYRWQDDDGGFTKPYRMQFRHPTKRVNESTKVVDLEAARVVMRSTKAALDGVLDGKLNNLITGPPEVHLKEFAQRYVNAHWSTSAHGHDSQVRLALIVDILGDPLVSTIDTTMVRHLRSTLATTPVTGKYRKATTINRFVTTLKSIVLDAHQQGYINKLPLWEMTSEKASRRDRMILDDELDKVVAYLRTPRYFPRFDGQPPNLNTESTTKRAGVADLLLFLRRTGMRVGEATAITFERNISMEERTVMVTADMAKGKQVRMIPMADAVYDLLSTKVQHGRPFPYDVYLVDKLWSEAKRHLKITDPGFVVHAIRHTVITNLLKRGVPITKVQALVGHESVTTTMVYTHLVANDLGPDLDAI